MRVSFIIKKKTYSCINKDLLSLILLKLFIHLMVLEKLNYESTN
jgi:hypothetical protein